MNTTPPSSSRALRTLLSLLAFAFVLAIFAYGWTVTDIDLSKPQEEQRQTNVQNAMRELLSPNIFSQQYDQTTVETPFTIGCEAASDAEAPAQADGPYITISERCGEPRDLLTLEGHQFAPNALVYADWAETPDDTRPLTFEGINSRTIQVGADGRFQATVSVPSIRGTDGETHQVRVVQGVAVGAPTFSDTTHEVIAKMTETIFLALIATAISILPSVVLSFFAAHNLMRQVRMSMGNLMIGFLLLPVGWALASLLLFPLAQGLFNFISGTGNEPALVPAASLFMFAIVMNTPNVRRREVEPTQSRLISALRLVGVALIVILVIVVLGGLAVRIGTLQPSVGGGSHEDLPLDQALLYYPTRFIGSIGELVRILLGGIVGVIGAAVISSAGMNLTTGVLKQVTGSASHILGGVLGSLGGALLMAIAAFIATSAALMGLLPPVIAASMAAPLLPALYNRFIITNPERRRLNIGVDRTARSLLSLAGAALGFYVTFVTLNVSASLVQGTLPSQVGVDLNGFQLPYYVLYAMGIGAVIGGAMGSLVGTRAAFPIGDVLYNLTRTILNALRSIEPLIMGLVFVIWVGIGPFAGVLALTLHSIASLGKLYSEQLENIDQGPIEALQSTGANGLQTIMYGAVPQIIPPYIAFTMYRWDINVRMSTIIGFVGGGGIGFLLSQQLNLLRYRDAGVAVLAIAIVVAILDYASAKIRERYI